MALTERRPLGIPVDSAPASSDSPAFSPRTASETSLPTTHVVQTNESQSTPEGSALSSPSISKSIENDLESPDFKEPVTDQHTESRSIETNSSMELSSKEVNSESETKSPIAVKSPNASPMELSPTSRSVSPDSLMNSGEDYNSASKKSSSLTSRGSTPSSVSEQNSGQTASPQKKEKKHKSISRAPIATGISTTIPVTGEKPKPEATGDPSLEDDVLYAIFVILYEKDAEGVGMTVKQICDVLIEQHPEMANLSTKTSNLVSAKLNAYVKRVEKGDSNLKYALSRDWADASPKRMVYVYRGLLAPDFQIHVKNIMEKQEQLRKEKEELEKQQPQSQPQSLQQTSQPQSQQYQQYQSPQQFQQPQYQSPIQRPHQISDVPFVLDRNQSPDMVSLSSSAHQSPKANKTQPKAQAQSKSQAANKSRLPTQVGESLEAAKQARLSKPRRQTMYDLGITKHTFLESPLDKTNLFVPYSSAPVTASLNEVSTKETDTDSVQDNMVDNHPNDLNDNFNSSLSHPNKKLNVDFDIDFDDFEVFNDDDDDTDFYFEHLKKNNKRSKSMSYLSMNKKTKVLTAAAAAPRAPRAPCSHSPNAAAAAAALHAAALKAISASSDSFDTSSSPTSKNSPSDSPATQNSDSVSITRNGSKKWLNVVRSGFLTQEIGAPEDLSLSDLDKFF